MLFILLLKKLQNIQFISVIHEIMGTIMCVTIIIVIIWTLLSSSLLLPLSSFVSLSLLSAVLLELELPDSLGLYFDDNWNYRDAITICMIHMTPNSG